MIIQAKIVNGELLLPELNFGKYEGMVEVEIRKPRRTLQQNSAFHKWLTMYADYCRENGVTAEMLLSEKSSVPVTEVFLKELVHHISERMYGKKHTRDLTTTELSTVSEVFQKAMSEKIDYFIPFPSKEYD